MTKFRIRKIRAFTINDGVYDPFIQFCREDGRIASRVVEKYMKYFVKRKGRIS